MQDFKMSEYFGALETKLKEDWKKYRNELVAHESPEVRGKIKYIEEILNWIDGKADEEFKIKQIERMIEIDNDY